MAAKKKTIVDEVEEVAKKAAKKAEELVEEAVEVVEKKIIKKKVAKKKTTAKADDKDDKKAKMAALLKKAKALEAGVAEVEDVDLKSKVKKEKGDLKETKKDTLVPIEDYLKSSIHLGTKVITPDMRKYVYRRRADGLAVFNTALLDDMIIEGAKYLAGFAPEDVIVVCKRDAGWKAVKKFSELTGIRAFTKKYPSGVLTNTNLDNFIETNLVFICDTWLDKNALNDANRMKIPVLSICDTNNYARGIAQLVPGNNKSAKSLGMIFYLITKLYLKNRKIEAPEFSINDFIDGWEDLKIPGSE